MSILLLAFGVSILILPQGNVTCYLEGVVMGRHKFRVFFEFCFERFGCEILLVSMYCSLRRRLSTKITTVVNPVGVRKLQKAQ